MNDIKKAIQILNNIQYSSCYTGYRMPKKELQEVELQRYIEFMEEHYL